MTKWLSRHPDGTAGIALVLLRLACAWMAPHVIGRLAFLQSSPNAAMAVSVALVLALAFGFFTRFAAFVPAVAALATLFAGGSDGSLAMLARASGCASLGLLGPGAYSIDAKVFGRRVIRLEPRAPDRTSDP